MLQPRVPVLSEVAVTFFSSIAVLTANDNFWIVPLLHSVSNIISSVCVSRPEVELPRTLFCTSYNTTPASQNRVSECALRIELYIHTYLHTYIHTHTHTHTHTRTTAAVPPHWQGALCFPSTPQRLNARTIHSCHQKPS
jgi:hypothetical protein